ncbi:hypothetical protein [Novosphingobium sp. 9]|uniref:hypothetical protein n=1 Tax=Novosphingobium sp. 9 TaxID=2025349 RepID=UPI0021B603D1|nr:hypothetical protein [Novosphingobium sp. 9]
MLRKIARLFTIKTRWEACMIIYALALGATERGTVYIARFPGFGGKLLFLACMGSVVLAGAKVFDCLKYEKAERERLAPAPAALAGNDNDARSRKDAREA